MTSGQGNQWSRRREREYLGAWRVSRQRKGVCLLYSSEWRVGKADTGLWGTACGM